MTRILSGLSALLLVVMVGAGVYLWDPLPGNPASAALAATAEGYDAEILRDEYGVPHIRGGATGMPPSASPMRMQKMISRPFRKSSP